MRESPGPEHRELVVQSPLRGISESTMSLCGKRHRLLSNELATPATRRLWVIELLLIRAHGGGRPTALTEAGLIFLIALTMTLELATLSADPVL